MHPGRYMAAETDKVNLRPRYPENSERYAVVKDLIDQSDGWAGGKLKILCQCHISNNGKLYSS